MWRHIPGRRLVTQPRQKPKGASSNGAARVLLAVVSLAGRGTVTISAVEDETGLSRGGVYRALSRLRHAGLVDWADGQAATLHPTVEIVRMYA